ncbi:MAG: DUF3341 domain-containing protein [Ignavibacteriales bacterium]|nr:DUF3341 domain-containing protein [Ignavibacteriales bacterium]
MNRSTKIFGVTALFHTPDAIIHAAQAATGAGYKKFDVHTPYPVHGMDKAMKLPPSKLGFFTLGFGLTGTALALLLMYYTMVFDYPMVFGGKPYFSLPAFIPVTFELTVLLATLATVIGMVTFYFKFPDNANSLHDTAYMKSVSVDKFGVCIEAADEKFSEESAIAFFKALSADKIETIYTVEINWIDAFSPKFLGFLVVLAVLVSGGVYTTLNKVLLFPPFTWMMQQEKVNAQSKSAYFADQYGMRLPVAGTVSRGHLPYVYVDVALQPVQPLTNPLLPSKANLALGQKKYLTFCSPCHGNYGEGDSRMRGQFPNPPSLHSSKVRDWKDGNIYHVMMKGQNVMPSYAQQLSGNEAWAVVTYVRALQKAKNATEDEIKLYQKEFSANGAK